MSFVGTVRKLPRTFWVANTMEIFERMAWYGFFAVSSLYITGNKEAGALGFTSEQRGVLQGVVTFVLYLLPVLTGALADRIGYKKMFYVAYGVLTPAYYLLGQFHSYGSFLLVFLLVALGAAIFKPVVVGTLARVTDDTTSALGFGIFYMMVNVGGFVGPIIAGIVREQSWSYVFLASSVWIATNFIWLTLFYREPTTEAASGKGRSLRQVLEGIVEVLGNGRFFLTVVVMLVLLLAAGNGWIPWTWAGLGSGGWLALNVLADRMVLAGDNTAGRPWYLTPMKLGDWRFALFLLILSGFWTMFNQIFMTMPEYIRDFVDTTPVLLWTADACATLGFSGWAESLRQAAQSGTQINPEYLINIDAGAIIVLQVIISSFFARFSKFTTMVVGTLIASAGIAMSALAGPGQVNVLTGSGWLIVGAIVVFAVGEMAASPTSQEYIGRIAPEERKALYMGYYFVAIALGNLFGGILSGQMYGQIARDMGRPDLMWGIFGALGILTAAALVAYDRLVVRKIPTPKRAGVEQ